jgi:dTDP-4-dehydrorhamnose 3,5-epimerase
MINDVNIISLRKIPDERGCIFHMLRVDDAHFSKFGEIYFSLAYPGVIKGWHLHTKQTQNYAVIKGMIKLVLFDSRESSPTRGQIHELFIGDQNYKLVTIPPGIVNGYKCIGTDDCIVANCSDMPYADGEMLRYDPLGDKIPYEWDIVMK